MGFSSVGGAPVGGAAIPRQAQRRRGITACATASCLVPEDYVRHLEYKGQEVALQSESKGYRFKLTPPVLVTVLHGNARAVRSVVPLNVAP